MARDPTGAGSSPRWPCQPIDARAMLCQQTDWHPVDAPTTPDRHGSSVSLEESG